MKMDLVPGPSASSAKTAAAAPPATTPPVTGSHVGGDPQTPGADDRNTAFRPVQGGTELQSGEKLLVEAYAAIWLILFALVLFSWRRQRSIDDRMGALSAAIDKAREKESGKGGA